MSHDTCSAVEQEMILAGTLSGLCKYVEGFTTCSHWQNIYHSNLLSCVNDYIEDIATFTALAKIYSTEYFCNTKVAGLGEIFSTKNFHGTQ